MKDNFETLLKFAYEHNFSESFWQVYFVEAASIQFVLNTGLQKIPRKSIFTFEDYKTRFNELLGAGHAWINLHLAGIIENSLLVIIEMPQGRNYVPREFVSIKFSLPEKRIEENNWKLEGFYEIID